MKRTLAVVLTRLQNLKLKLFRKVDFDYRGENKFNSNSVAYSPTDIFTTQYIARLLLGKGRVLDVGCGKGLLMYRLFISSITIDGIEINPKLAQIAKDNFAKLGCKSNVTCVSAVDFSEYSRYDAIILYNPFDEEILRKFISCLKIQNFHGSLFYINSVYLHLFDCHKKLQHKNDVWGNDVWQIFF